jgi:iron(III) transport system ATP-binding protein
MFIEFDQVSKRFQRARKARHAALVAVRNVSLTVAQGEMLALVGASGSGKTTLLRCLAGLETPDEGRIRIGARDVFSARDGIDVPTEQRDIGLIFQSYALWPHLTVERNVAYPLERRKLPAAERKSRVANYLELIDCGHLASRYPHELSGGQQQRIALARALVYEPAVVLFDEPLSNLDPTLRERLRAEIRELQRRVGFTGIYVTHDQSEAFYVGDRIALVNRGELVQIGTADQIYTEPGSPLVASFAGATNAVKGELADNGASFVSVELGKIALRGPRPCKSGNACVLLVRPEAVRLAPKTPGCAEAVVLDRTVAGALQEYALRLSTGRRWRARIDLGQKRFNVGEVVGVAFDPGSAFVFEGAVEAGIDWQ